MVCMMCYSHYMITDDLNLAGCEDFAAGYDVFLAELAEQHEREAQEAIVMHIREGMTVI